MTTQLAHMHSSYLLRHYQDVRYFYIKMEINSEGTQSIPYKCMLFCGESPVFVDYLHCVRSGCAIRTGYGLHFSRAPEYEWYMMRVT